MYTADSCHYDTALMRRKYVSIHADYQYIQYKYRLFQNGWGIELQYHNKQFILIIHTFNL